MPRQKTAAAEKSGIGAQLFGDCGVALGLAVAAS